MPQSKKRYVISKKNQGRSMPLQVTALIVVGLKAFSAPQWIWGAAAMLIIYLWYLWVIDVRDYQEADVDIFEPLKKKDELDRIQRDKVSQVSK